MELSQIIKNKTHKKIFDIAKETGEELRSASEPPSCAPCLMEKKNTFKDLVTKYD